MSEPFGQLSDEPSDGWPLDGDLRDPSRRRPIREDLDRLWSRRHFVTFAAMSNLHSQHMDTVLGSMWHLLNPAWQVLVYYIIFGLILEIDRGVDNFLPFLAIGIFAFQYMRRSIVGAARSLIRNRGLIQSIAFPRATLPVAVTVSEAVAFLAPAIVMLAVARLTGETVSLRWLLILPIFGLQTLFVVGASFIAARLTFYFRDFENILDFLFRMAFYFSGVLFLVERFVQDGTLRALANLNPLLDYLSLYRWAVMDMPVTRLLVISAFAWALITPVIGYVWFQRRERDYGRE
jgi:teichoic acid transport system permease protein